MPAGPERFAYRAAEGEKWVDVNLTDSTLTAYEGYTQVHGPILINHGGVGHETVTGTYHVYLKRAKQDMGCTPEWPFCERDVLTVIHKLFGRIYLIIYLFTNFIMISIFIIWEPT